jgi:hypothetical protein
MYCSHIVLDKRAETGYTEKHRPNPETRGADLPPPGEHPVHAMVDNALNRLDNRQNPLI